MIRAGGAAMKFLPACFNKPTSVLALTFVVAGAGWSFQSKNSAAAHEPAEIKAIDALSRKDIAACMKNDVDTLCSLWTEDGVLLMPGSPPLVGRKAICSMLQEQKTKSAGAMTIDYTEDWEEVRIVGDYAWQWGKMSQTQANAGKQETARVNAIRILHREGGEWKVSRAAVTPAPQ
jgi:uncharacterized protein (TIGR02246 family)